MCYADGLWWGADYVFLCSAGCILLLKELFLCKIRLYRYVKIPTARSCSSSAFF